MSDPIQLQLASFAPNYAGQFSCELYRTGRAALTIESLDSLLANTTDEPVVITGLSPDELDDLDFTGELSNAREVWLATDICYLLSLDPPGSDKQFAPFLAKLSEALEDVSSDVLAQSAQLVNEAGLSRRLGLFAWELDRRHDILNQPVAGEVDIGPFKPRREELSATPRQELPPDLLSRIFGAQQKFEDVFESYEERPQQVEMARAVETALAESTPLVVEAGTGVGKSLAYLVPLAIHAARHGKLCLVSTNTLNLQQQLMDQDLPRLAGILDELDLRISLAKGREHYLCIKRLEDLWLKNSQVSVNRRGALLDRSNTGLLFVLKIMLGGGTAGGDMGALPSPAGLRPGERNKLERNIDCGFSTCLGERCEYRNDCHFYAMRAKAQQSHIVVANHALVFSLHDPDDDNDTIVSKASAIVFDEAHNLESAITNQQTLAVDDSMPVELGNSLLSVVQDDAAKARLQLPPDSLDGAAGEMLGNIQEMVLALPGWIKTAAAIRGQVNELLFQAESRGHFNRETRLQLSPPTATPPQQTVLGYLARLASRLQAMMQRYLHLQASLSTLFANEDADTYIENDQWQMELKHLGLDLAEAVLALGGWQPEDSQKICWFNAELDSSEPKWSYLTAPLDAGPAFQSLFNAKESCILCSATLSVAGSFDYLQSRLGFTAEQAGRTNWLMLDSPFDYGSQSMMLLADDLSAPTGAQREQYLSQVEEVVQGVGRLFERGVLVLFNSYRDMEHIAERLEGTPVASRLLVQGLSGSRAEIATTFRSRGDRILLATRSFWEGFDVSGDALSCVVLAKLPFANFRDPIHACRQRAIDSSEGDSFRQYSLPMAAMQLKQGFGRLIRTRADYGCVFLLDSRLTRASYGKVFLDSLPGPGIFSGSYVDCLAEAEVFMNRDGK